MEKRKTPEPKTDTCQRCGDVHPEYKLKYGREALPNAKKGEPNSRLRRVCDRCRKGFVRLYK